VALDVAAALLWARLACEDELGRHRSGGAIPARVHRTHEFKGQIGSFRPTLSPCRTPNRDRDNLPDRTVYQLSEAGQRTAREWLVEMLATPATNTRAFLPRVVHLRADARATADVLEHREAALVAQMLLKASARR
jgi:hypothetical protein